jgi:hypothetical protein
MVAFISDAKREKIENSQFIPVNLRDPKAIKGALGLTSSYKTLWGSNGQMEVVEKAAELGYRSSLPADHADHITAEDKADLMNGLRNEYSYTLTGSNNITKPLGSVARGVGKFGVMGVGGALVGFGVGFTKAAKFFTSNPNAGLGEKILGAVISVPFAVVAGAVTGIVGTLTGGLIAPSATGWLGKMKDKAMDMVGYGPESKVNDLLERAANLGARAADEQKVSAKFATSTPPVKAEEKPEIKNEQLEPEKKVEPLQPAVNTNQDFVPIDPAQTTAAVAQSARAAYGEGSIAQLEYDFKVITKYMNDARVMADPAAKAAIEAAYETAKTAAIKAGMTEAKIKAIPAMETDQFCKLSPATLHDLAVTFGMEDVIQTTMNKAGKDLVAAHRTTINYQAPTQTVENDTHTRALEATKDVRENGSAAPVTDNETINIVGDLRESFKVLLSDDATPEAIVKAQAQLIKTLSTVTGKNKDDINAMDSGVLVSLIENVCKSEHMMVPPHLPNKLDAVMKKAMAA